MPTIATPLSLPEPLRLSGRRVVVTGAANGIGRATAGVLASLGAELLLTDVASLDATCADLAAKGVTPTTLQADLLGAGVIGQLFAGGRVHALAHCAGIVQHVPWNEDPDWDARFDRTMAAHGGGNVVLLGSLAALTGGTLLTTPPDYAASKGGVHALVRQLARKGAPSGVLVNAVAPGPVDTRLTAGARFPPGVLPLGRMATPEEIAWPVAFLCTQAAAHLSGEIINVNGGAVLT